MIVTVSYGPIEHAMYYSKIALEPKFIYPKYHKGYTIRRILLFAKIKHWHPKAEHKENQDNQLHFSLALNS